MSDSEINKDCLHHYDNRHIQVRWDYFCLCSYDKGQFNQRLTKNGKKAKDEPNQECMAKILRILETLTNHEKTSWFLKAQRLKDQGLNPPPEPKEFSIELSYSAVCSLLYSTYGESTVRNSIAYLIQLGFIKQYQQTKNSIPSYVLNTDVLQKALNDQAERTLSGVEFDSQQDEDTQVSNSTAKPPNSTAKRPHSTAKPPNSTPPPVEFDTNNIYKNSKKDNKQKEESIADESTPSTFAPNVAPSPSSQSSFLSSEDTKAKPPSKKKEKAEPVEPKAPPVMPPVDAPWPSKETAVQIVEAKKGRIYSTTTRKQELAEASAILDMSIDNAPITRVQFESAWDDLSSSSWWDEHGKPCMIKYLRRDDTIVGIIKKLKRKGQGRSSHSSSEEKSRPSFIVSEERKQKNIDKLRALAAASAAKE